MEKNQKAFFNLPGLFEFYEFYKKFLPLFYKHREYFYPFCEIGSIYGAPEDCIWGGGRVGLGNCSAENVLELMNEYGISATLTFSNSLLREEHLSDRKCNKLCELFSVKGMNNGIIIHSDLLLDYIKRNYPDFYFVSSTTKVLTDFSDLINELNREDFRFVVPDFRFNNDFEMLGRLDEGEKSKVELLCNEYCPVTCRERKSCYENVGRKNLGEEVKDHICHAPKGNGGYRFSEATKNPSFIGLDDIKNKYLPLDFSHFKIEGRGLGSALILEFILYYLTKPEYQINVREEMYLDSMLDLF